MKSPIVTLLTDFGTADHYVAAMKGVILGICPSARLVDISHEVAPYAIAEGAYTLAQAWRCFPKGTIHLAVVDPGVGSERRPIVVEVAGHRFVAPDNGLLGMVLAGARNAKVREIGDLQFLYHPVSTTFHGRDIFAPVAAHLAKGFVFSKLGRLMADPVRGDFHEPVLVAENRWEGRVLKVDRFGNVITNFDYSKFQAISLNPFKLRFGARSVTRFRSTYAGASAGQLFALRGSAGYVEVSQNQGSAAAKLHVSSGSEVELDLGAGIGVLARR